MEHTEHKILFIDDNRYFLEANRSYFVEQGFDVGVCGSGAEALSILEQEAFDCIVLDVSMPGMSGYEVCMEVRRQYDTPVIFLSCIDRPDDKVRGLMLGGDVYMTKPYDLRELHAQVLACLRRGGRAAALHSGKSLPPAFRTIVSMTSAGEFAIDRERRIVRLNEHCAVLSKKEMALLLSLLEQPGQPVCKDRLCNTLWPGDEADENRLQGLVRNLRRKVEFAAERLGQIESVYGTGYRLSTEEYAGYGYED